jgi:hypothetical protein
MSPVMDGVRLGPLDPDRGENFGQVGAQSSARQLIRHHVAMHPPVLIRALSRVRQDARSEAVDREEVEAAARKLYADAGEALPEDSRLAGFAVRGDDETPELQVVTFTWTTKGGRTGKGFVPYREMSSSVEAGDEAVRIEKLKAAGLPWQPKTLAQAETKADTRRLENADAMERELAELRRRLEAVEGQRPTLAQSAGGGSGVASSPQTPEGGSASVPGSRGPDEPDDEFAGLEGDDLTSALEEAGIDWTTGGSGLGGTMTPREARDALRSNTAGGDAEEDDDEEPGAEPDESDGNEEPAGSDERPAEPWAGYEGGNAQDIRRRVRESRDPDLARAVLAYEQRPDGGANRSTVVAAANEVLDHTSG